jgi:pimeloyl-ACP methyl ester carboxylesterase
MVMLTPSGGLDFGEDAFGPVARRTLTPLARAWPLNMLLYRLVFHRRAFIRGWFTSQGFYEPGGVSREIVDGFLYFARKPDAAYAALPFLTGDLRFDLAPYMRDLGVPAAMIWGSDERQVGRETGERLAALNPAVPLTVIDRACATPELELPAQTIAAIESSIVGMQAAAESRSNSARAVL